MASVQAVKEELLSAMESDFEIEYQFVRNGKARTQSSPYKFAGLNESGAAVGISGTAMVSLNRLGQDLLFLAAAFEKGTTAEKSRIATLVGKVYFIFGRRPFFTNTSKGNQYNYPVSGQFGLDPSGPLAVLGMMAIDKSKVIDHANFVTYSGYTAAWVRSTLMVRMGNKLNWAADELEEKNTDGTAKFPYWASGDATSPKKNLTWAGQKLAKFSVNGIVMVYSVIALYKKLYNPTSTLFTTRYNQSVLLHNNIAKDYGTTFDSSGNVVDAYTTNTTGMSLSLAIGSGTSSRGMFTSCGYNAYVGLALMIQGLAEVATTSTSIGQMVTLSNTARGIDALKIMNYYRDRIANDGRAYELGAHYNRAGDASRFIEDAAAFTWTNEGKAGSYASQSESVKTEYKISKGFIDGPNRTALAAEFARMVEQGDATIYKGQGAYLYPLAFVLPNHSLFSRIGSAYAQSSGKASWEVDWSNGSISTATALATTSPGGGTAERVVAGLAAMLWGEVTEIA